MSHPLLRCALAGALALAASAACASDYTFTFRHLCDGDRCIDLDGSFSGTDLDANGAITLNELGSLSAGGFLFHPDYAYGDPVYGSMGSTTSFNYLIGSDNLSFTAFAGMYRVSVALITSDQYSVVGPIEPSGTFLWNADTTLTVAPVPEPGTALMAVAGCLVLARRRGSARRPGVPR